MDGRRSTDLNYVFGYPREMPPNILPTESDVVSHSLFLKRERIASKEWKQNTPLGEIATKVTEDICELWSKTGIPHFGTSNRGREWVIKKTEKLITRSRDILKVPKERRNNVELLEQWGALFDISQCPHRVKKQCDCPQCSLPHPENCNCLPEVRVPETWQGFLWDQREARVGCLTTVNRELLKQERERMEHLVRDREKKDNKYMKLDKQKTRESADFGVASDSELIDSQGDRLSEGSGGGGGGSVDECEDDSDIESDWEDIEVANNEVTEYNTLQLRRFSRECDRYKTSNRAGAKVANALLKDLGIVTAVDQKYLVCPNKLRRERIKWGQKVVDKHNAEDKPDGWYYDGKKCATLVKDTKYVNVQIRGKRGRGSKTQVTTTGTKVVTVDHYSVVCEPGGEYETHVNPNSGTGLDIAAEIVSTIRERGGKCKVLGCDGTSVNTGIHTGSLREIQRELKSEAHQFVCLLHLNELFLRHRQTELDGPTTGPQAWEGPIGGALV